METLDSDSVSDMNKKSVKYVLLAVFVLAIAAQLYILINFPFTGFFPLLIYVAAVNSMMIVALVTIGLEIRSSAGIRTTSATISSAPTAPVRPSGSKAVILVMLLLIVAGIIQPLYVLLDPAANVSISALMEIALALAGILILTLSGRRRIQQRTVQTPLEPTPVVLTPDAGLAITSMEPIYRSSRTTKVTSIIQVLLAIFGLFIILTQEFAYFTVRYDVDPTPYNRTYGIYFSDVSSIAIMAALVFLLIAYCGFRVGLAHSAKIAARYAKTTVILGVFLVLLSGPIGSSCHGYAWWHVNYYGGSLWNYWAGTGLLTLYIAWLIFLLTGLASWALIRRAARRNAVKSSQG
ncbi:MAG: hypothetical protein EAX95_04490 [Candidatus Thorarchaeota archaeon]|nr:hypothetical protein [Candidatus Thorarchaeota archaeon]